MAGNGVIEGFSESDSVTLVTAVGVCEGVGEDAPQRVHVIPGSLAGIREKPGIHVVQGGYSLEGVGNRLCYPQELRQPARYPPTIFVGYSPVEQTKGGKGADVLKGTGCTVRKVVLQGDGPAEAAGNLLDRGYQRPAVVSVDQEPVSEFRVEFGPGEAGVGLGLVAKPVLPIVGVPKRTDLLVIAFEHEADQPVGRPAPR